MKLITLGTIVALTFGTVAVADSANETLSPTKIAEMRSVYHNDFARKASDTEGLTKERYTLMVAAYDESLSTPSKPVVLASR